MELATKISYAEKIQLKKQRLESRAEKVRKLSDDLYTRGKNISERMVFGQPILVGHHSEGRHRADIKRMNDFTRKSINADKQADELERRANAVGTGGISGLDEEALPKLKEKLARLESNQELMKNANKQYKFGGFDAVTVLSDEIKKELASAPFFNPDRPLFEGYSLSNNLANIHRIKDRISTLEKTQLLTEKSENYKSDNLEMIYDDARIQFIFDGKPADEVITLLKRAAFKWSPSRTAWVRQLTPNAIHAARCLIKDLEILFIK